MRIYLDSEEHGPRVLFQIEDLAVEERPPGSRKGLRGWIERQAAHYKVSWSTAESALVKWMRAGWNRLHRGTYADEPLLAHLRSAHAVEIVHAPSLPRDDAVKLWEIYLASRRRRHGLWFAFNVVIAPLTIVLAPLPGPNLIGYWFAYRAFHHGLILAGLWKVKRGHVRTTFLEGNASAPSFGDDERDSGSERLALPDDVNASAGSSS